MCWKGSLERQIMCKLFLYLILGYIIASLGIWYPLLQEGHAISPFSLWDIWHVEWNHYDQLLWLPWGHAAAGSILCIAAIPTQLRHFILKYLFPLFTAYLSASVLAWFIDVSLLATWDAIFTIFSSPEAKQNIFLLVGDIALLCLLAIYYTSLTKANNRYGSAKWATKSDLPIMGLNHKTGIVLGLAGNQPIYLNDPLSVLVCAPPGTGKTSGIAIPTLLNAHHSFIVHDPKGEIYDITASFRESFSTVILFDPAAEKSAIFNVFDREMLPESLKRRAYITNIAEIIIPIPQHANNYFETAARNTFIFFAEWMVWDAERRGENTSIPQIASKIVSESDLGKLIREMAKEESLPDIIKEDANSVLIAAGAEKQWAGVIGTLSAQLDIFRDPLIADSLKGRSSFLPDNLRKQYTTIYVKVRDEDRNRLSPVIKLIFSVINNSLLSVMPKETDHMVTFIIDEFPRLGRMDTMIDLPALGRGYKVNAIFIAQDINQIKKRYSNEDIKVLFSTCSYKVIFRQGEYDTAKTVSELIGKYTSQKRSINKDAKKPLSGRASESLSEEGLLLVSPQDILNLEKDKCLVIAQGFSRLPFKAGVAFWYRGR